MKESAVFLLVMCWAASCLAQGIPCEKKELAELKEMDKETLAHTYRDFKSRLDGNQEAIRSIEDFSFSEDVRLCTDEMLKAERVYKDMFGDELPDCGK